VKKEEINLIIDKAGKCCTTCKDAIVRENTTDCMNKKILITSDLKSENIDRIKDQKIFENADIESENENTHREHGLSMNIESNQI